ncbi:MAG: sulfatase-like hydrolase/transferase [Myxococcota bacterium]
MLAFALAACAPPEADPIEPAELGPPTDTVPSFYGSVPKNVIFVSMDTTRKDLLARYGNEEDLVPFLDGIAETGFALDRHHSCSDWTMPGMLCSVTGLSNVELGFVPDLNRPDEAYLPQDTVTLASRLSDAGWRTILVTSNSWFSPDHGSSVGYDVISRPDNRATANVFAVGIEELRDARAAGEPWFLHLHVKEPHVAYNPPDEYLEGLEDLPETPYDLTFSDDHYRAGDDWPEMSEEEREVLLQHLLLRYHGEVRWMNDQLGDAFESLRREGFLEDTLVVFYNDHGEQFWEHGEQTHAYGLNREENDGIGLFWATNIVPETWTGPTVHEDFVPTVLGLLGVETEDTFTGYALGTAPEDRAIGLLTVARHGVIQAVVQDGWKLIYRWSTDEKWLYDTETDPEELVDLHQEGDPKAVELWASLEPLVEQADAVLEHYAD